MNYTEAVKRARSGEEAGFKYLYEETYKSKYYLAMKYMQNEEAAKDVLQDAYIKAFDKLDTLENPDKFASWLGVIVANMAKNALQKQNLMLFTDMAADSKEEVFEYQIEDDNTANQPEMAYTQKETSELVHELIDTLPEEQRLSILMFYMEGQSISEIASALDCSENTVKSRLHYGRKNIRFRAEALQKKGYKLYNIAPVPLVLYLIQSESQAMAAQGAFTAAGQAMAVRVMQGISSSAVYKQWKSREAVKMAKKGFIHTLAGKLAVTGVGLALVTAGVAGVVIHNQNKNENAAEENRPDDETGLPGDITESGNEQESERTDVVTAVTDEQYPELLAGGLTKDELAFVLAYAPESMTGGQLTMQELSYLLLRIGVNGDHYPIRLQPIDDGGTGKPIYSLADVNNFLSVITDYRFSEENNENQRGNEVSGDTLAINVATPASMNYVTILNAVVKGDEMLVEYEVEIVRFSEETGEEVHNTTIRAAVLHKTDDGRFRVTDIADANVENQRKEAYASALYNLYANHIWPNGEDAEVMGGSTSNLFAICDIDRDGREELIIEYCSASMAGMKAVIYEYDSESDALQEELCEFPALTFYDNGFIRADWSHNQSDNEKEWPYTMYQYDENSDFYREIGTGETNTGSVEAYVGNGREIEVPFIQLTEEHIASVKTQK